MIWLLLILFGLMNLVAYFHAHKFTHFSIVKEEKTANPEELSIMAKVKALMMGIDNPRPAHTALPRQPFETILLQSNKQIECWKIKTELPAKGTVIIFHGYSSNKSLMLDKSDIFLQMGYNTVLVDFMGSGGSEGQQTTIGYKEATQVVSCYRHLKEQGEDNIYVFASSMGAVATLRAFQEDKEFKPKAIMLECPFGSMYQTTCARFKTMGVPTFPMAGLLVFWGGVQNGFWAFSHNPTAYASSVDCPMLLMYGEKDDKVSIEETNQIFQNVSTAKQLKLFPKAGHENYLNQYRGEWTESVSQFLTAF